MKKTSKKEMQKIIDRIDIDQPISDESTESILEWAISNAEMAKEQEIPEQEIPEQEIPCKIMRILQQAAKDDNEYVNPHFLLAISELLESYYAITDDNVDEWIQDVMGA